MLVYLASKSTPIYTQGGAVRPSHARTAPSGLRRAALPAFGVILDIDEPPFPPLLKLVADQLKVSIESWDKTKGSGLATCVHARPDPASRYDLIAHSR
jgi:hypothetical protein